MLETMEEETSIGIKLNPGEIVVDRWMILSLIGEGGFGTVYKCAHVLTMKERAIKIESAKEKDSMIKLEVTVLKTFRKQTQQLQRHACRYFDSGHTPDFHYVVMELGGPNLNELRRASRRGRFTVSTSVRLGIQCLESIEALHRIGFLHRDIKPANYAMGRGADHRVVFILDFGLARKYITDEGTLRERRKSAGFRGTVRYASINTHAKKDLGRHDDLWSWIYIMIEFQRGELPWRKIRDKNEVSKRKREMTSDQLLDGMEPEFHRLYYELQRLQFSDAPNYEWFYDQLKSIMTRKRYRDDEPFDWESDQNDDLETDEKCGIDFGDGVQS